MPILAFKNVAKSLPYGFWLRHRPVLRDVSLRVEPGEIYGFLGPNGAGKTTSMKCLLGLLRPDRGSIDVFGRPGHEPAARSRLGYLPEQPYFYPHLSGRELVLYFGRLFGIPKQECQRRAEELLELVGMSAKADLPLRQFSKGMMQRIGLVQALINDPELVILDEPMSGLDPIGRREMKDVILGLKRKGATVFFSSHILADAEALCDRVGLLYEGRIVRESSVDDLLEERVRFWDAACEGIDVRTIPEFEPRAMQGERIYYRFQYEERLERWLDRVRGVGGRVVLVSPHRSTLEDYFLATVTDGRGRRDTGTAGDDSRGARAIVEESGRPSPRAPMPGERESAAAAVKPHRSGDRVAAGGGR